MNHLSLVSISLFHLSSLTFLPYLFICIRPHVFPLTCPVTCPHHMCPYHLPSFPVLPTCPHLTGPSCLSFLTILPHLPPHLFFLTYPQLWERPVALEAELALTLKVLETMADSSLGDILDQPLHTLHHIHSELQACVSAQDT